MKTAIIALLCLTMLAASVAAAPVAQVSRQDAERALTAIFVFGDTIGWMGCGFVVGDGSWVVTTADLVTESFGPDVKTNVKRVTVLSAWTGDAYDAEVKSVDEKANLALIKLPFKGLPAMPLAGPDAFKKTRTATSGQILSVLSGDPVGAKWDTWFYAIGREEASGKPAKLAVRKWKAGSAVIVELKSLNWLFASRMEPESNPPRAGLVWREEGGAVAIYNRRVLVGETEKAPTYGQCLLSTEMIKILTKAGLAPESLKAPPEPAIKQDKVAEQGLQVIWATLTSVILGKWPEAQQNAKMLVDLRKQSPFANLLYGVSLAGGGKVEEGVKSMDEAIKLDPATPNAYYSRGIALASLTKSKEAEADLKKAASQSPSDIKPLIALAELIASDKARLSEAEQTARKAVALDSKHPRPRLTLALILKGQGNHDQATAELKTALGISPDWGLAKAALAATYEAAGKHTEAETSYRDLVKAEPKNPDALFALASYLADHDKKDEAKKLITELLAMKPPKGLEDAATELQKKL